MKVVTALLTALIISITINAQCKLDYSNYQLVFEDNFDTYASTNDMTSIWRFDYPWGQTLINNPEVQYYEQGQVSFPQTGILRLTATRQPSPIPYYNNGVFIKNLDFKSGMLFSTLAYDPGSAYPGQDGFAYGMFEIRCKLPKETGPWPAFWLWSGNTEIDIFEAFEPRKISLNVHDVNNGISCQTHHYKLNWNDLGDDFHIYSCVWTPTQITFFLDGREIRTVSSSQMPTYSYPAHILVNLAMTDWEYHPNPTILPDVTWMDIDYIKVYKPAGLNYSLPYKTTSEWMNRAISTTGNVSYEEGSVAVHPADPNTVFYRGTDNKIYKAYKISNTWYHQLIPYSYTSNSLVKGDLLVHSNGQIYYKGQDNRLQSFWLNGSTYEHIWISSLLGNQNVSATPRSMCISNDGQIFYKGSDNKIHRYYWSGTWQHQLLPYTYGNANGYPQADYVLGDVIVGSNNQVFYKGFDNRVQAFWINGGVYQHAWIDDFWSTSQYMVSTTAGAMTIAADGQLYYIGTDNKIHRLYWSGDWIHEWLPHTYGDPSLGYPNADYARGNMSYNNQYNLVIYKGYDGRIQLFDKNNSWNHWWVNDYWNTDEYDAFNSFGSPSSSVSISSAGSIFYCDKNYKLRIFNYEACEVLDMPCDHSSNLNRMNPGRNYISEIKDENSSTAAVIYPNPNTGSFTLQLSKYNQQEQNYYMLYSTEGQLIRKGNVNAAISKLNLSSLSNGIYILRIYQGKNMYHKKIVISK